MTPAEDLALALELADLADAITLEHFRAVDLHVETKPDLSPVSEADTAVERAIRQRLAARRPQDAILGEEYGAEEVAENGRRWILDPIDGTQGYVRGVPVWATLVALEDAGEYVVGVASAPALGRRWWAAAGLGAFTSGGAEPGERALRVSAVSELADAQISFGGLEEWERHGRLAQLLSLSEQVWRTRGFGDFWQYVLVAEGSLEAAADPSVSVWDLAAPLAIVTEAGGRLTDLSGTATPAGGSGLASNGLVHDAVLGVLASG